MGGVEKALLPLLDTPLLARVLARFEPQVDAVAINANREVDRYQAFGHPVLPDPLGGFMGPLAGVLAGLRWAQARGAKDVITVAGDTPFLPLELVARLSASQSEANPIAMAAGPDGRHPTFALWPVSLADDLEAALGEGMRKVVAWSDAHGTAAVEFPADPYDPFFNVNSPADMDAAEKIAAEFDL